MARLSIIPGLAAQFLDALTRARLVPNWVISRPCKSFVVSSDMSVGETELEMVQRHVRQGERHVSRQLEIIADITIRNQPTGLAEDLLFNFEDTLRAHRDHLSQLI